MHECTGGSGVLRALYSELTTKLDARIVVVNMYQRNALTLKELQSIQSLRDRPVEAAETLLNIIIQQPDAVYLCFLDILKHTEQQHIYQRLVKGAYRGISDVIAWLVRHYQRDFIQKNFTSITVCATLTPNARDGQTTFTKYFENTK